MKEERKKKRKKKKRKRCHDRAGANKIEYFEPLDEELAMAVQRLPRAKKSTVAQNVIFAKKDQSHQCVKKKKPATVVVAFKEKLRAGVESLLASSATNYDACLGLAFDALKAATRRKLHQIKSTSLGSRKKGTFKFAAYPGTQKGTLPLVFLDPTHLPCLPGFIEILRKMQ
jgi:hypothetical protein